MSFVNVGPQELAAGAATWQGIGSAMDAQVTAAAAPTTGVVPAAVDEVSTLVATQFALHGHTLQAVAAQAKAIHEAMTNNLFANAASYAATEAANAIGTG
jgi:hypothetical protein